MQKKGLTKREKTLLLLAASVGILYLAIAFLILPFYNQYNDKQSEYNDLLDQKMEMDRKLLGAEALKTLYDGALADYRAVLDTYPLMASLPNEELDRLLTGLCRDNGLERVSLGVASNPAPFLPDESEKIELDAATFATVDVNMTLNGTLGALKDLMGSLGDIPYIRLTRVNFTFTRDYEMRNISVTFEVAMLNKLPQEG